MKIKKILPVLVLSLVIVFLFIYSLALKRKNDQLFQQFHETRFLLEKAEFELSKCNGDPP